MSNINWLAVIVCVIVAMISGFIWYHPSVFYKPWRRGLGKESTETGNPNPIIYVFTVIAAFIEAVSVAILLNVMGADGLGAGISAGFMLWLGFVAPTNLVNKLFAGHGFTVWAIEAGNHLVNLMLFGAILGAWR